MQASTNCKYSYHNSHLLHRSLSIRLYFDYCNSLYTTLILKCFSNVLYQIENSLLVFISTIRASIGAKINVLGPGPYYALCFKTRASFGAHHVVDCTSAYADCREQEAQLPLRNRASATYFFVAKLISIAHSCL